MSIDRVNNICKQPFEYIKNDTDNVFRLTYWKSILLNLNQNITITVHPKETIEIPKDYCVDEFIIISEDYSYRVFKFHNCPTYYVEKVYIYSDDIDISRINNMIYVQNIAIKL